jgi:hypothetical protein
MSQTNRLPATMMTFGSTRQNSILAGMSCDLPKSSNLNARDGDFVPKIPSLFILANHVW